MYFYELFWNKFPSIVCHSALGVPFIMLENKTYIKPLTWYENNGFQSSVLGKKKAFQ